MIDLAPVFFAAALLLLVIFMYIASYIREKSDWNKGICAKCEGEWEWFEKGPNGERHYRCSKKHMIWINWYRVDH